MAKKIVVEYYGASRGNEPMHLHTDTYTPQEWEAENKDECDKEAQEMALVYFEVSGWYEVTEILED
ncbi:hypothetical protein [Mannheimia varigena]|uniref:hypothetical protein n=1 Tax=Mannheimia varigena TaxID=85404 RepID=UPI0015B67E51|nr:hypothetical protein [Mannheimia varigena]QLD33210.1 hypothetical protein A6B42_05265 [Mannheimia varigena]